MTRIVATHYRYKRPPRKRAKAVAIEAPQGGSMIDWVVDRWLGVAGLLTAWFVDPGQPQFEIARGILGIVLVAIIVIVVGLVWPTQWRRSGGSSP